MQMHRPLQAKSGFMSVRNRTENGYYLLRVPAKVLKARTEELELVTLLREHLGFFVRMLTETVGP